MVITVPASSANLGPGFDSIGIAVNRYLTLTVTKNDSWRFIATTDTVKGVPEGKDNLIYEVAEHVAVKYDQTMESVPCEVKMASTIPLARGLGSSASAIIAGIELANQLLELNLTNEDKVRISSLWEGHPDNVSPSVYGGLLIGSHTDEDTHVVYCGVPEIDIVMLVPEEELMTKKARGVLPTEIPYRQAILGSSVSNVLVAAILQGNWELAGKMMVRDVFHHPYRKDLVPGLEDVLGCIHELGAYGAALSGAGPAIICFTKLGEGIELEAKLNERFPQFATELVKPDANGVVVEKIPMSVK